MVPLDESFDSSRLNLPLAFNADVGVDRCKLSRMDAVVAVIVGALWGHTNNIGIQCEYNVHNVRVGVNVQGKSKNGGEGGGLGV